MVAERLKQLTWKRYWKEIEEGRSFEGEEANKKEHTNREIRKEESRKTK